MEGTGSPSNDSKKEGKDKKKWRSLGKMFIRRESSDKGKPSKDCNDSSSQDTGAPSSSRKRTATTMTSPLGKDEIVRTNKPHPLLRPRSVVSMTPTDEIKNVDGETELPAIPTQEKPENKVKPQFGTPPVELYKLFPEEPVPAILIECIEILEKDIRKEGIFRIPGRMTSILQMKNSFENGNGLGIDEPNTLDIAGLVAQFFRELPEPLLTYDLYYNWVEAAKQENEEKIRENIMDLLKQIPEPNYNTLKRFIAFLCNVSKNSGANRMGARNLALVFGASLLNPPAIDQYDLANIKLQCSVVEHMITGYGVIFEGEESSSSNTKVREKQVATIPAGNPAAKTTQQPPVDRRKGFMKRKSTFFTNTQYSGNSSKVIHEFITPIRSLGKDKKTGDNIEQQNDKDKNEKVKDKITSPRDESEKKKRKLKKKKKRTKSSRKNTKDSSTNSNDSPIQERDKAEGLAADASTSSDTSQKEKVTFAISQDKNLKNLSVNNDSTTTVEMSLCDGEDIEIMNPIESASEDDEDDSEDDIYDESDPSEKESPPDPSAQEY